MTAPDVVLTALHLHQAAAVLPAWLDRALSTYETYVWTPDCAGDHEDAMVALREVLP